MYAFNYHRATSARQAANLLAKAEDAKLLAGGHTLLPTMKLRLASPANIIDLSRVPELKGIEQKGRYLMIGAMTTHAEVAHSDLVRGHTPGSPRWRRASATRMCATAARSAAPLPTTTPRPTIRRAFWR